jgi:hypothetical protein
VAHVADRDAFNWGYDPVHWGVPEGSYSQAPSSSSRVGGAAGGSKYVILCDAVVEGLSEGCLACSMVLAGCCMVGNNTQEIMHACVLAECCTAGGRQ